ncbi:hypothetical protein ACELLULO517_26980 [Acidisoma cellulosilytica]|uniref:Uncharacterized protein n=1 Tax=Acidisoma cellulosilyticum TaxID=2802395 RepID=A0A964E6M4_9PROT|nr:hypothetical protein [Acidisoma cellulosilyticum]MCB8883920.1 hypothetical protein [Acidisoma cellulosilyticum]
MSQKAAAPVNNGPALCLADPDWLYHRLMVTGPAGDLASLRAAARGAGLIPWRLDLDALAEDWFHRLVAPGGSPTERLSVAGARILADRLRAAVERRQAVAASAVGLSQACPFDLHSLVPVPGDILRLGPDDAEAKAWLWTQWGTTVALRHVTEVAPDPAGPAAATVTWTFWSADWSPWRAVAQLAARWPGLQFALSPVYDIA